MNGNVSQNWGNHKSTNLCCYKNNENVLIFSFVCYSNQNKFGVFHLRPAKKQDLKYTSIWLTTRTYCWFVSLWKRVSRETSHIYDVKLSSRNPFPVDLPNQTDLTAKKHDYSVFLPVKKFIQKSQFSKMPKNFFSLLLYSIARINKNIVYVDHKLCRSILKNKWKSIKIS